MMMFTQKDNENNKGSIMAIFKNFTETKQNVFTINSLTSTNELYAEKDILNIKNNKLKNITETKEEITVTLPCKGLLINKLIQYDDPQILSNPHLCKGFYLQITGPGKRQMNLYYREFPYLMIQKLKTLKFALLIAMNLTHCIHQYLVFPILIH